MKKFSLRILLAVTVSTIAGCSQFLDIQPRDRFLESQVFRTEAGITSALNGIYLGMAQDNLYGGNLTLTAVEALAQRYNFSLSTNHSWGPFGQYAYNDIGVQNTFDRLWSDSYKLILNINVFLDKLENSEGLLPTDREDLLKGEAIGLRALLHFDLLRLFGPVYSQASDASAIPYYTQVSPVNKEFLPAEEVINAILTDLEIAEQLLTNDPIREEGILASSVNDVQNFYRYRSLHMNYFAVKGLQSRVNLYAGRESAALQAAQAVIQAGEEWFPWTPRTSVSAANNPDRTFSTEVLFSIQNLSLYQQHNRYFSSSLSSASILAPQAARLTAVFEGNENDYRFSPWWKLPVTGGHAFRTFFKYEDVINSDVNTHRRFLMPLIRLSEIYYIAAETHPDPVEGLAYLNTVRFNRGLPDVATPANLQSEIEKEYAREFFGEGQLFFYYKRLAAPLIPNGSAAAGTVNMDQSKYQVPVPRSESGQRI